MTRSRAAAGLALLAVVACQSSQTPEVGPPSHLETVRGMHAAFGGGDIPGVIAALDSSVRRLEAEGFIPAVAIPTWGLRRC